MVEQTSSPEFGPTTGIDMADDAIAQAKSKFPQVTFLAGNVFEIELPGAALRRRRLSRSHRSRPGPAGVRQAHRPGCSDLGGYLIVATPNRFVHFRNYWAPIPPGHIEQWLSPGGSPEAAPPASLPRASDDDRCADGASGASSAWSTPPS